MNKIIPSRLFSVLPGMLSARMVVLQDTSWCRLRTTPNSYTWLASPF